MPDRDERFRQHLVEAFATADDVERARRRVLERVRRARRRRSAAVVLAATATAAAAVVATVVLRGAPGGGPPVVGPAPGDTSVEVPDPTTPDPPSDQAPADLPPGTTAEPAPWRLTALSPDGRHLTVQLDQNDCGVRLHTVGVTETTEAVDVAVQTAVPTGAAKCAELPLDERAREVTLEQPLGDRALTGCRLDQPRHDCRQGDALPEQDPASFTQPIMTADDLVLVGTEGLVAHALSSGEQRWDRPELDLVSDLQPSGALLVGRRSGDTIVALDAATGLTVWETFEEAYGPHDLHVGDDVVVVPDRVSFTRLHGLDVATGALAWQYEATDASAITAIVPDDTAGTVVVHVRGPDESTGRITVLDQSTGQEQGSFEVPAGDLVGGDGSRLVFDLAGPEFVVHGASGEQLLRSSHPDGRITALQSGVALVQGAGTLAGVDLRTGAVTWQRTDHQRPSRPPQGGLLLTQQGPRLTAIDVATGEDRFVVDLLDLPAPSVDPAVISAASTNTLFALTSDGRLAWWRHVPSVPPATQP